VSSLRDLISADLLTRHSRGGLSCPAASRLLLGWLRSFSDQKSRPREVGGPLTVGFSPGPHALCAVPSNDNEMNGIRCSPKAKRESPGNKESVSKPQLQVIDRAMRQPRSGGTGKPGTSVPGTREWESRVGFSRRHQLCTNREGVSSKIAAVNRRRMPCRVPSLRDSIPMLLLTRHSRGGLSCSAASRLHFAPISQ